MEYSVISMVDVLLYCLFLLLFAGTLILGFAHQFGATIFLPPIILPIVGGVMAIWIAVHLWPMILDFGVKLLTFILTNIVTLAGTATSFIVGMGEVALAGVEAWVAAQLAVVLGWAEAALALVGIGIESGYWLIDISMSLLGGMLAIAGTVLVGAGYGFGSVVVILLNLVAITASSLTMLAGATPTLAMLVGGAVALFALPYIVQLLLALIAHSIYQVSFLALRVSTPVWQSSWLLGWVAKMLMSCIVLVFYLERSLTHRPTITLSWNGEQWAVA